MVSEHHNNHVSDRCSFWGKDQSGIIDVTTNLVNKVTNQVVLESLVAIKYETEQIDVDQMLVKLSKSENGIVVVLRVPAR